jgi:serine phosphatase RsbU (regulator of sigma subunit)/DNA-binding NarL/FixJ family response regulator
VAPEPSIASTPLLGARPTGVLPRSEHVSLLLVEDNAAMSLAIRGALDRTPLARIAVEHVTTLGAAMERLREGAFDAILLDLGLPDSSGLQTCERVLRACPDVPVVVLTSAHDAELGVEAVRCGAQDFLPKSAVDPDSLGRAIRYSIERHRLRAQAERAAENARAGELRFRTLIQRSLEGLVVIDANGAIRLINPAAEALLGPALAGPFHEAFELPRAGTVREIQLTKQGGDQAFAEIRVVEVAFDDVACRLVAFHDVSDRKRAERVALAQAVQRAYLPERMSRTAGPIEVSALNELCQDASGDYYDFFDVGEGHVAIPIGDVTGHGLGPALLMAQGRAFLRSSCRNEPDLSRAVESVNDALALDVSDGRFMSMFVVVLDPSSGNVQWCNAGHVPALLVRAAVPSQEPAGRIEWLEATGPPLGIESGAKFDSGRPFVLAPGDVLLLCTDGATEAMNRAGDPFGEERLAALLRKNAARTSNEILDELHRAVTSWRDGLPLGDDLTLVVIRHRD